MTQANGLLRQLHGKSPGGFAIGLHIHYTTPRYFFQSYDREWFEIYSGRGLLVHDPIVRWGFSSEGTIRWSALADMDEMGVLKQAGDYGMRYGVAISVMRGNSRSIAGFARSDREMTDIEIAALHKDFRALHDETLGMLVLSPDIHETLRQMSIYLTHG
ncbi:autoinducer binding domain-containing protein [Frigidibacter sp. SD6-1]|uniref:autoinducer binding domain-containing protein n=1 Tax=Frigidibacter sp. SD6-1 TaxID=3032581 RepID=UPI0024DFA17A|nr:autoinducer binding domain-containing protein [Frigidibacter sp. SD6-1]